MQKNGAGLTTAHTMWWDQGKDGFKSVRWESDTMYVHATVYGISMDIEQQEGMDM